MFNCNSKPAVRLTTDAIDTTAGNVRCFKIETPTATYYLEKNGMGLSSLIDRNGNNWISFHNEPGSRASGEFRGFPNSVHKQDGSFFHPKNEGTDPSVAIVDYTSPDHVIISGISGNGNWECRWDFYPAYCTFTMTKMPKGFKYWALYEGTPGGQYDDTDWWMTSDVKRKTPLTISQEGDIPFPEWIVFGDEGINRVLFLLHHEDDEYPDDFYQMEKKMTVFGFGRERGNKFLNTVPQSFSIGFVESTDYKDISQAMNQILTDTN